MVLEKYRFFIDKCSVLFLIDLMKKQIVPPPWKLNGRGYIFVYKFNKNFIQNNGFVNTGSKLEFAGGFGFVMIVEYKNSDAGPYDELLFIPGKTKIQNNTNYSITKIYVSTQVSVDSGRENWGIPKEMAHFSFENLHQKREIIRVGREKEIFFEAEVSHSNFYFPITTRLLPIVLQQFYNHQLYFTQFKGSGRATFAKIHQINIIPNFFPPVGKSLFGLYVDPFELEFPVPTIKNL